MKLPTIKIASALALFSAITLPAFGQYSALLVPKLIQYQGRVATGTGGAWAGTEGYFVFALLVGQPGAETVLWNNWAGTGNPANLGAAYTSPGSNQVVTLPVNSGVFSIRLGDGASTQQIPATVFFDSTGNSVRSGVKLAVWFSPSDSPPFTRLSPDVEFTSVPFAMVAGIAESVQDRSITSLKIADGEVKSNNIGAAAVTTAKIASAAVGSAQLATGLTLAGTTTGTFSGSGSGLTGITAASLEDSAVATTKIANSAVTTAKIADGTLVAADMSATLQADSLIPTGTVMAFAGTGAAPTGWWLCDGSSQLRNDPTFARLFDVIKTAHGWADPTRFNLPDYRGRFLRGKDSATIPVRDLDRDLRPPMNANGNAGNNIGSIQGDEFKSHNHSLHYNPVASLAEGGPNTTSRVGNAQVDRDDGTIGARGGSETRPMNAYVNYIIKL